MYIFYVPKMFYVNPGSLGEGKVGIQPAQLPPSCKSLQKVLPFERKKLINLSAANELKLLLKSYWCGKCTYTCTYVHIYICTYVCILRRCVYFVSFVYSFRILFKREATSTNYIVLPLIRTSTLLFVRLFVHLVALRVRSNSKLTVYRSPENLF